MHPLRSLFRSRPPVWLPVLGGFLFIGLATVTFSRWWPPLQDWVRATIAAQRNGSRPSEEGTHHEEKGGDSHDHEGHAHAHDEGNSLELSKQAMGNIGLTEDFLRPVELETFDRSITVPAIVVERPGRTRLHVSTPMSGVITHVHAVRGEAIMPGTLLFEIRITADELVATQTQLLKSIGELDVENREIARLEQVTKSGVVPQRMLLERQYAKDKLEVLLSAQKEALRLQGLSDKQIEDISVHRRLLRDLQIRVPFPDQHSESDLELTDNKATPAGYAESAPQDSITATSDAADNRPRVPLILQDVLVSKGERVLAGSTLAMLSDMEELYVEGRAFEQDAGLLATATNKDWKVTAVFELPGSKSEQVPGLDFLYAATDVSVQSRTLAFYVRLPNQLTRDVPSPNGLRFVEWKYRPGQRLQVKVPVERWEQQIVLPVDAIAQEGAESFVFLQSGSHFERTPVQVDYRDQTHVVVKNDGSVFPGDVVALRGAHQLQMALKNKSGGGADPHAGHNH